MATRPPAEPTRKHPPVQPNAHPYAIKTTSSALLSRSNSSPHSANHIKHHYIPSPQVPTGTRVRHHHSSSLPSVETNVRGGVHTAPMPLPIPPSMAVALPDNLPVPLRRSDEPKLTHRVRRAETMPSSSATPTIIGNHSYGLQRRYSHDQDPGPDLCAGLPPNPRQWNTDEVTTYLETSSMSGNNPDNKNNFVDIHILEYVQTRGLTGRELLRLTDADLADTPLSEVQRTQLLERSRILRADVLRGRIYADSYHSHEISDDSNDIYSRSIHSFTPFHNVRGASASVDDLRLLPDSETGSPEAVFPSSPVMSLHRSNSASNATTKRYQDLARMRMRRRGKVKGLVETWERASTSGSECSAGEEGPVHGDEVESDGETDPRFESTPDVMLSTECPSDPSSTLHDPPHDTRSPVASPEIIPQEPTLSTPPPPYTHMYTEPDVVGDEEEPTIEELLASSSGIPLRGARAWEADFGLGETVKRIPISTNADADSGSFSVMEPDTSHPKKDGRHTRGDSVRFKESRVRGSTGSRGKNTKTEKRIVTAIFTGSPCDAVSEDVGDGMGSVDHHRPTSGIVRNEVPARSDLQDDPDSSLRMLEESIAATRAQVEAFRLRLEAVEADTTRRETESEPAQISGSFQSPESESERRRPEAHEWATPDKAEPLSGETLAKTRNEDVLGGWETMSLRGAAHAIIARAMGWLFPYGHICVPPRQDQERSHARTSSSPGTKSSPAKRSGYLSVMRMSCNIVLFSFAICAAVFRRMGLGRWIRRA